MSSIQALTSLTEDELLFQQEILKFARNDIGPHVMEMDEQEQPNPELLKKLFELGLMGIEVPAKYGGSDGSFFMAILAIEALATVDPAISVTCDVQNTLVNNILLNYANDDQRERYLTKLTSDTIGSYCLTEADSGSDAFAMKARAHDEGDHYRLEGKKVFITNAKEAELFIVFATVDPSLGYRGVTAFFVPSSTKGFSLGKKETKLGIRASSTCEVVLDNVLVPKSDVIGEVGKGYKIAIETLNEGRIGIAAQMLGLAQGAFDGAMRYATERQQFGKAINQFQAVQFDLAKMAIELETARLMVYNAARLKDGGGDFVKEAAMAKYHVSMVAERVASQSLEIYGGYGFIKEFPAEKFYRDVKIGKLYEGTSNMQLQTIFKLLEKNANS